MRIKRLSTVKPGLFSQQPLDKTVWGHQSAAQDVEAGTEYSRENLEDEEDETLIILKKKAIRITCVNHILGKYLWLVKCPLQGLVIQVQVGKRVGAWDQWWTEKWSPSTAVAGVQWNCSISADFAASPASPCSPACQAIYWIEVCSGGVET